MEDAFKDKVTAMNRAEELAEKVKELFREYRAEISIPYDDTVIEININVGSHWGYASIETDEFTKD